MKTWILVLTLALTTFGNFAAEPGATAAVAKEKVAPCCRVNVAAGKPTDRSLYLLESKWSSDRGAQVGLSVLRGRPQVVAMFFTQCEYACPIIVNDMKKLQAKLPPALREGVDFLLVSMDPDRDSVAALADFRKRRALPLESWTLLRGSQDDVRELAALLGVNYAREANGQFAHSNVITLLNAEGEVVLQQVGLQADSSGLEKAISGTLKGDAR
jgi:protein SCO1